MKITTTFLFLLLGVLSSCGTTPVETNTDELNTRQDAIIAQYFNENKITTFQKHSSGFYYTISVDNSNIVPSLGDSLSINYTGNVLYGKVFDSNLNRQPYQAYNFRYLREKSNPQSSPPLIAFQDAAALLAKGEKGTFYFPSRLLYASNPPQSNPIIPPNTILVFEIEILDIFRQ